MTAPRSIEEAVKSVVVDRTPPHRPWFKRRRNRRVPFASPSVPLLVATGFRAVGLRLLIVGKLLVVMAVVALSVLAGRQLVRHVIASPRFAVKEIRVAATTHVSADEIQELAGVEIGDRLLTVDPDRVAAQLATHPWIGSARVRRELPSALAIEVTERRAVASALMGALYLLDEGGRPFKRATFEEADGLPVITGVTREQYAALRPASEAVFREALALLAAYNRVDGAGLRLAESVAGGVGDPVRVPKEKAGAPRPKLSEIHVDPRNGFSLVLFDGAGEIRLGREGTDEKLARLERILAAAGPGGPAGLATVYLDGALADQVTVRLARP
jgi:POTRA domain-containing FtsQ-type protein/cell division protein FtsQ